MAKKFDLKLKGTVGYWDFNKHTVDNLLDSKQDQEVNVLIDSLGGSVADALSISSAFANHGNVHVHYRGMNASAATISSMGAKHISIDASALYLVHKCSFVIFEWDALNADELLAKAEEYKKKAEDAEKIDKIMEIVTEVSNRVDTTNATNARTRILRFDDELINGVHHSREYFQQTLEEIDTYEEYCDRHPKYRNNACTLAIEHIRRVYTKLLDEGGFIQ